MQPAGDLPRVGRPGAPPQALINVISSGTIYAVSGSKEGEGRKETSLPSDYAWLAVS